MERARMNRERERLCDEMERLERRISVIRNRLGEIEKAERWLEHVAEASQSSTGNRRNSLVEDTKGKRSSREMVLKY
jgi:prefoldin subunit 5